MIPKLSADNALSLGISLGITCYAPHMHIIMNTFCFPLIKHVYHYIHSNLQGSSRFIGTFQHIHSWSVTVWMMDICDRWRVPSFLFSASVADTVVKCLKEQCGWVTGWILLLWHLATNIRLCLLGRRWRQSGQWPKVPMLQYPHWNKIRYAFALNSLIAVVY